MSDTVALALIASFGSATASAIAAIVVGMRLWSAARAQQAHLVAQDDRLSDADLRRSAEHQRVVTRLEILEKRLGAAGVPPLGIRPDSHNG